MYYQPASLNRISVLLRNDALDLQEYINAVCDRIGEADKVVRSLLPEKNRRARLLKEAQILLKKFPAPASRPPLFGVLVGIKDLFNVDGLPTKAGSKLPAQALAGAEADLVTRLKQAGALILGKTQTTEFAYFSPAPTRNPVNPDRTPGGSSSGSAAAVAAGFCPLALGTQTIASVIRPAAYCGVIGFKPTQGRLSTGGIFPFSPTLDQPGFFTQDLPGALLASATLIPDWDPDIRTTAKPNIFLPADAFLVQANYDAFNRFYEKADLLTAKGYEVNSYPLFKNIREVDRAHRELIAAEFYATHKQLFKTYGDLYSEPSRELFKQGKAVSKTALAADLEFLRSTRREVREIMQRENVDVWISPATTSAPPIGLGSTGNPAMSLPWTFAGLPSVTLPVAKSSHNLPLGLQVCGGFGRDESLLQHAGEILQALRY